MERKMPIFADRFLELRGKRTQEEFAKFLGISRPTVGFYESGQRLPDALVLRQIAGKCNVSADYLLGLTDEKTPNQDIQAICKKTGLCETSIKSIMSAKDSELNSDGVYFEFINELISSNPIPKARFSFFWWLAECLFDYQEALFARHILEEAQRRLFEEEFDKIGCTDVNDLDRSTLNTITDIVVEKMEKEREIFETSEQYSERTRKMIKLHNCINKATSKCGDRNGIPYVSITDTYRNNAIRCLTMEFEGIERGIYEE